MDRPMLCSANGYDSRTMFIERDGYDICATVVVQLRVPKQQYYTVFQEKSERI